MSNEQRGPWEYSDAVLRPVKPNFGNDYSTRCFLEVTDKEMKAVGSLWRWRWHMYLFSTRPSTYRVATPRTTYLQYNKARVI